MGLSFNPKSFILACAKETPFLTQEVLYGLFTRLAYLLESLHDVLSPSRVV